MFQIKELTDQLPMTKICRLCYRLLTFSAKGYTLNEQYVAQWIEMFFEQALQTGEDNNIFAEPAISDILTNNKKLMDKQITKRTIERIIDLCLEQTNNERFLNLLGSLCICEGNAVVNNQNNIIDILFGVDGNGFNAYSELIIPIKQERGNYYMYIDEDGDGEVD